MPEKRLGKGSGGMKLSDDEVRAIAAEARLSLSDSELSGAVVYMNKFLGMVDRFKELDLENVAPFCFAEASECPLREDVPLPFEDTEEILKASPNREGLFIKVPRIMEE